MIQAPGTISCVAAQSPVNPKPCGTFSWPTSKSPSSPFFLAKSLLLPKPRGKKHSKTSWSALLSFRTAWSFSPLQNHMDIYVSTCFRDSWFTHLLWSCVVSSFSPKTLWPSLLFEAAWSLLYFRATWSLLPFRAAWSLLPYGCRA